MKEAESEVDSEFDSEIEIISPPSVTDTTESEEAVKKLHRLLYNVNASGLESTGGVADQLPKQPNLFVKNFGYIPVPLTEISAEELLKLCKPAPFGKNYDTVIDSNVRDCYQLEPEKFEVRDPKWGEGLARLVDRVGSELGWHGAIEPRIYKLLLYKTGGHFKKHQDTEKEKNMFGTLVLQLPSIYEGGEFVCYHRNGAASHTYKFGNDCGKADNSVNFVAHYSDVEHEVLQVKSGYRLALVYSLCCAGGNIKEDEDAAAAASLAKCLSTLNDGSSKYAVLLNHQYTEESLKSKGVKLLKGVDNDRYTLLREANALLPTEKQFNFYIIYADFTITYEACEDGYGYRSKRRRIDSSSEEEKEDKDDKKDEDDEEDEDVNDYDDEDEDDGNYDWDEVERYHSFQVYDFNGSVDHLNLSVKNFKRVINPKVLNNPFADLDRRKYWTRKNVEIEGYQGNAAPSKTTEYRKCMLVFWPCKMSFKAQLQSSSLKTCVNTVYNAIVESRSSSDADVKNCEALIKHLNKFEENHGYRGKVDLESIEKLFVICHKLGRLDLIEKILRYLSSPSVDQMKSLIEKFTFNRMKKSLTTYLHPVNMEKLDFNCKLTKALVDSLDKQTALDCFKLAVAPILDEPNLFKQISSADTSVFSSHYQSPSTQFAPRCIQLAQSIVQFPDANAEYLRKFFTCLASVKQSELKKVKDGIIQSVSKKDLPSFMPLFLDRMRFLKENTKIDPVFSWKMPGSISGHPKFDAFLRSETQTTITYQGEFNGIAQARKFRSNFSGLKNGYSISILSEGGTGKNAFVTIQKTKDYFNHQVNLIASYRKEYAELKALLKEA